MGGGGKIPRHPGLAGRSRKQVVPDFRSLETHADGSLTEQSLERFREKMTTAMEAPAQGSADKKPSTLKDKYMANRDNLSAFDHAIKLSVHKQGLKAFLPERYPEPVPEGGERFMVSVASLPEEVQEASPGREERSCVAQSGHEAELECIWGVDRRTLFLSCDRGSIGWPGKLYLFSRAVGLRGDVILDISHRRNNGYLQAWHFSGLSLAKVELGIIFNLSRGPFHGCANFHSLRQTADQLFKSETWECPLFAHCYELIVKCKNRGRLPPEFGTSEHMQTVWADLPRSSLLSGTGTRMKLSRWMAWCQKVALTQPVLGELLLVLLYIGILEGWFTSVQDFARKADLSEPAPLPQPAHRALPSGSASASSRPDGGVGASSSSSSSALVQASSSGSASAAAPQQGGGLQPAIVGEAPPQRAHVHGDRDGLESARKSSKNTMHLVPCFRSRPCWCGALRPGIRKGSPV